MMFLQHLAANQGWWKQWNDWTHSIWVLLRCEDLYVSCGDSSYKDKTVLCFIMPITIGGILYWKHLYFQQAFGWIIYANLSKLSNNISFGIHMLSEMLSKVILFFGSNDIPLHYTWCRPHQHQHQKLPSHWTISQCLWLCSTPPEWRVWVGRTGWRVQGCQRGLPPQWVRDLSTGTPGEPWRNRLLCSGWRSENAWQLGCEIISAKDDRFWHKTAYYCCFHFATPLTISSKWN